MSELNAKSKIKLKALVIDDEEAARLRLNRLLQNYIQHVEVIGEACDGDQALLQINSLKPDVVFMDIKMPGRNGFQVLSELSYLPLIVFVTAYEQYAVKAFEENSLDYLLKPVELERLDITIQRLIGRNSLHNLTHPLITQLMEKLQPSLEIKVIPIKNGDRITLVPVEEVVFFQAKDKYVNLHLKTRIYLLDQPLTYIEDRLPKNFIRVQRGCIINKQKIIEIRKYFNGGYHFEMADSAQTKLKSGHTYNNILKRHFEFYSLLAFVLAFFNFS